MSNIHAEHGLGDILKSRNNVFVLFYAPWCPFSQRFLPVFEEFAQSKAQNCLVIKIDDNASLCEEYSVEVVPTVLFFKNGRVQKRLDGISGKGLNKKQLMDFTSKC